MEKIIEKTITFNIPKGYVIDKEKSTDNNIVLKLVEHTKSRTWDDYCKKMKNKESYYCNFSSFNEIGSSHFGPGPLVTEFDNLKDVKSFVALSKLIKLRKDWIGEWEPDWTSAYTDKYAIYCTNNSLYKSSSCLVSHIMSFPTAEMRDEFFDYFKDLLEQAKELI